MPVGRLVTPARLAAARWRRGAVTARHVHGACPGPATWCRVLSPRWRGTGRRRRDPRQRQAVRGGYATTGGRDVLPHCDGCLRTAIATSSGRPGVAGPASDRTGCGFGRTIVSRSGARPAARSSAPAPTAAEPSRRPGRAMGRGTGGPNTCARRVRSRRRDPTGRAPRAPALASSRPRAARPGRSKPGESSRLP